MTRVNHINEISETNYVSDFSILLTKIKRRNILGKKKPPQNLNFEAATI